MLVIISSPFVIQKKKKKRTKEKEKIYNDNVYKSFEASS